MKEITTVENVPDNTLKSLRTILFRELIDLRNDEVEGNHAIAVAKVASQITTTYKVEVEAVKVANELKDKNIRYAANLHSIQTTDTKELPHAPKES